MLENVTIAATIKTDIKIDTIEKIKLSHQTGIQVFEGIAVENQFISQSRKWY